MEYFKGWKTRRREAFRPIIIAWLGLSFACAQFDSKGSPLGFLFFADSGNPASSAAAESDSGSSSTGPVEPWGLGDWSHRNQITFQNAWQASDLIDFPLFVKLDPTRIDYAAADAEAADLCFLDDDNATRLDHEIEVWNPGGTSAIWLRVPRIAAAPEEDKIFMYYGGPGACPENSTGVWNSDFAGVWHLNSTPGMTIFDPLNVQAPEILTASGTVRALAYTDADGDGRLITVDIDAQGTSAGQLDGIEFEVVDARNIELYPIAGDVYALVYESSGSTGIIKTVSIQADGSISGIIDTHIYDATGGGFPEIVSVTGNVFAIAHSGMGQNGYITTISIDNGGTIGGVLDSYRFWTAKVNYTQIVHVTGNIFAVAFENDGTGDGHLITTQINNDGSMNGTAIDSFEFDDSRALEIDLLPISGSVFALVHQGPDNDGWSRTIDIAPDGTIVGQIDEYEFSPGRGTGPKIFPHTGDIYLVAYSQWGGDGFVHSLNITPAGIISNIDSHEYNPSLGLEGDLLRLSPNVYTVAVQGTASRGSLHNLLVDDGGRFYETKDSTAAARHARTRGFLGMNDPIPGRTGSAFALDGTDDGIYLDGAPSLAATNFTITVQARPRAGWGPGEAVAGVLDGRGWGLRNDDTVSGQLEFFDENGAGVNRYYTSGPVLSTGDWQHLAVSYDGDKYRLFLDGFEVFVSAGGQTAPTHRSRLYFGRVHSNGFEFSGDLDELRLSTVSHSAEWDQGGISIGK